MARLIVNKVINKNDITSGSFLSYGEIVISNQVGLEGIAFLNKNNDIIFIGPTSGSGGNSDIEIPEEFMDSVADFVRSELKDYYTKEEIDELLNNVTVNEEFIKEIIENNINSYMSGYTTVSDVEGMISESQVDITSAITQLTNNFNVHIDDYNSLVNEFDTEKENISSAITNIENIIKENEEIVSEALNKLNTDLNLVKEEVNGLSINTPQHIFLTREEYDAKLENGEIRDDIIYCIYE